MPYLNKVPAKTLPPSRITTNYIKNRCQTRPLERPPPQKKIKKRRIGNRGGAVSPSNTRIVLRYIVGCDVGIPRAAGLVNLRLVHGGRNLAGAFHKLESQALRSVPANLHSNVLANRFLHFDGGGGGGEASGSWA